MNIYANMLLWLTYIASLYFTIFWFLVFLDLKPKLKKEENKNRKITKFPLVSVLVPAYNEEATVIGTVKSVLELDYPKNYIDIIVINDGSKDNTGRVIQEFKEKLPEIDKKRLTVLNQKNQGKATALNNGIKIAKGQFFACLDADSFVDKDSLQKMLYIYENETDDLVIVTPAMKVGKPNNFVQKLQRMEYIVALFIARLMSHLDCIYVAPGPFSLYRTKVIKELGGFSTDNLTEDMEIAYRVQKHHYKIKQCFDAYVFTTAPSTTSGLYNQRNRWFKGGLLNAIQYKKLLMNKNYGDFGMIQMSINLFNFFLSVAAVSFFIYYVVWPFFTNMHDMWLVNFDFFPYLQDILRVNFSLLNTDISKVAVLLSLFLITLTVFYLAHKNARENVREHGTLYIIPYFLFYYLALSFIALIVIGEVLLGKKQKW